MNARKIARRVLRDRLYVVLMAFSPIAVAAQFAGMRNALEIAICVAVLVACYAFATWSACRKATDRIVADAHAEADRLRAVEIQRQYDEFVASRANKHLVP